MAAEKDKILVGKLLTNDIFNKGVSRSPEFLKAQLCPAKVIKVWVLVNCHA